MKLMGVADRSGFPLAVYAASASPHEVTLVTATLAQVLTAEWPERLTGDKAYDPTRWIQNSKSKALR
jgi:hypothetical protein